MAGAESEEIARERDVVLTLKNNASKQSRKLLCQSWPGGGGRGEGCVGSVDATAPPEKTLPSFS